MIRVRYQIKMIGKKPDQTISYRIILYNVNIVVNILDLGINYNKETLNAIIQHCTSIKNNMYDSIEKLGLKQYISHEVENKS